MACYLISWMGGIHSPAGFPASLGKNGFKLASPYYQRTAEADLSRRVSLSAEDA